MEARWPEAGKGSSTVVGDAAEGPKGGRVLQQQSGRRQEGVAAPGLDKTRESINECEKNIRNNKM